MSQESLIAEWASTVPCPLLAPAAERAAVERPSSRSSTTVRVIVEDLLGQAGGRHHDLEGRAGRVGVLDRPVLQRVVGVVDQRLPVGLLEAAGEQVGVERRRGDQGEDLAVPGIHRHHRPHLLRAVEPAGGLLLEVEVDRQGEVLAGDRRVALVLLEQLAAAVDHHHPLAVPPAQLGVVGLLDPLLADHVARLVGAVRLGDLVQAGLAQVAEDVSGLLAVAVEAQVLDLDLELRVLELLDAEAGHLGEREVLGQEHRLEHRHAAVLVEDLLQLGHRPAEHAGGVPEAVIEARRAAAVDHQAVAGDVLDQQAPLAVEDQAAGGLDRELAQPVVLGELAVVVPLDELGEPEAGGDHHQHAGDDGGQHADAADQIVSMLANDLHDAASILPEVCWIFCYKQRPPSPAGACSSGRGGASPRSCASAPPRYKRPSRAPRRRRRGSPPRPGWASPGPAAAGTRARR